MWIALIQSSANQAAIPSRTSARRRVGKSGACANQAMKRSRSTLCFSRKRVSATLTKGALCPKKRAASCTARPSTSSGRITALENPSARKIWMGMCASTTDVSVSLRAPASDSPLRTRLCATSLPSPSSNVAPATWSAQRSSSSFGISNRTSARRSSPLASGARLRIVCSTRAADASSPARRYLAAWRSSSAIAVSPEASSAAVSIARPATSDTSASFSLLA